MAEAAAAAAATPAPAAAAPAPTPSAGISLAPGPDWANSFKSPELKAYVTEKKFTDPEQLADRYQNLEKKLGVPADRLLKLPEKMEGDEARGIWERLGAPKEAKGYELGKDNKDADPKFTEWAEGMFHKNSVTKAQALGIVKGYEEYAKAQYDSQIEARKNAITQADTTLKNEWGPHYETNINLAKQGAKVLGLDAKTLDVIEAMQGREVLFKNLQKIGVSVGEATFVAGTPVGSTPEMTQEQAVARINELIKDTKFGKRLNKGDAEARAEWDKVNRLAAPGEKQIG